MHLERGRINRPVGRLGHGARGEEDHRSAVDTGDFKVATHVFDVDIARAVADRDGPKVIVLVERHVACGVVVYLESGRIDCGVGRLRHGTRSEKDDRAAGDAGDVEAGGVLEIDAAGAAVRFERSNGVVLRERDG